MPTTFLSDPTGSLHRLTIVKLIADLQARLQSRAPEPRREWWERYLRGSAAFRRVTMGEVRAILHIWYGESVLGTWGPTEQAELALQLIRLGSGQQRRQEAAAPKPTHYSRTPPFGVLNQWASVDRNRLDGHVHQREARDDHRG